MSAPSTLRLLPVHELLAIGGDSRQVLGSNGRNKYGCTYRPDASLVAFGSCTASTVTPTGYRAAEQVAGWIRAVDEPFLDDALGDLHETIRNQLLALLVDRSTGGVDIVLTPSGTDAEMIALELFASRDGSPVENIVVGPAEVGSGTTRAAGARCFDPLLPNGGQGVPGAPVDDELAARTTVRHVGMRCGDGTERDDRDIDTEVVDIVEQAVARGARVLVHVVAHSKTGVHAPNLTTVDALAERHGDRVAVLIDAAQGRFSRRGLNESLRAGRMVIITGSKFFGGPPFAGALLVPSRWTPAPDHRFPSGFGDYFVAPQMPTTWTGVRRSLPPTTNLGLLLRWHAAMAEMSAYYAVPSRLRLAVLRAFEAMVPELWSGSAHVRINAVSPPLLENDTQRLLESKTTVFPFSVSTGDRILTHDELLAVYRWMCDDVSRLAPDASPIERTVLATPVMLGQPVRLSSDEHGAAVLRIAISGSRITTTCVGIESGPSFDDRLDALRRDLVTALAKLDLVAARFDRLAAASAAGTAPA